ncbi:MAG: serine/threonine-protein kinase [Planctomycetota bacterium]
MNPSDDERIERLLRRYYALIEEGESPSVSEICQDDPDLEDRLARLVTNQSDAIDAVLELNREAAAALLPPENVGRYRIGDRLGSGGMGVVYQATTEDGQEVALKLLRPEFAVDSSRRLRFRREARITAALEHPNIVPVVDTDVVDGHCFLAMRLLRGKPLDQLGRTLEEREAARIGAKVAYALQSAHEVGVVHRDVKPGNIFLEDDEPFLLDFGLARNRLDWSLTNDSHIPGTLAYMAPEQLRGRSEQVGPRADVYALSATLHRLVVGAAPFDDSTPEASMRSLVIDRPRLGRGPGRSRSFARIIEKALEKDPNDRFQSAEEFGEELQRFADGNSILTRARPLRLRLQRRIRRHPQVFGLAAIAVLTIVWLGGQWQLDRARRARDYAERIRTIELDVDEGRHLQALLRLKDLDPDDPVLDRERIAELRSEASGLRVLDQIWDLLLAERNSRNLEPLDRLATRLDIESPTVSAQPEAALAKAFIEIVRRDEDERSELRSRFDDARLAQVFPRTTSLAISLLMSEPQPDEVPGRACEDYVFAALLRQLLAAPAGSVRAELSHAQDLSPTDRRANLLSAHLMHREGNLAGARNALRALLRPEDPRPEIELWIAYVAMRQYDHAAADRWIDRAAEQIRELGDPIPLRLELARIRNRLKQGDAEAAETMIVEAEERYGHSEWMDLYRAQILASRNQFDEARTLLQELSTSSELRLLRLQSAVRLLVLDSQIWEQGTRDDQNSLQEQVRRATKLAEKLTADDDRRLLSEVARVRAFAHFERGEHEQAVLHRALARENDPLHPQPVRLFLADATQYRTEIDTGVSAAKETDRWFDDLEKAYGREFRPPADAFGFAIAAAQLAAKGGRWDLSRSLLDRSDQVRDRGADAPERVRLIGEKIREYVTRQSR